MTPPRWCHLQLVASIASRKEKPIFTVTAIEAIRITHTVDRMWVQNLLTQTYPDRAQELTALSDAELAAELAAAASQRPGITAAFEALLAEAADYTRTSDFAIGLPGHEFPIRDRGAATQAGIR